MNKSFQRLIENLSLPVYELSIEGDEELKVNQISLVDEPAINEEFKFFNKENEVPKVFDFKTESKDKQIVYGAAMIPYLPIYRTSDDDNPEGYYVYYTPSTVEQIAHKFLKEKLTSNFNIEHSKEKNNAGAYLIESFITKSRYKEMGFDLPAGTWIVSIKIEDSKIWDDYVKSGKVKGFSVEILANYLPVKFQNQKEKDKINQIKNLLIDSGYLKK